MESRRPEQEDATLIVRSAREPDVFAELFDRHVHDLLRFFYRRTSCAQTAADLMAETFAAAFASRRSFRDTGAPGRAWLFTIARRQLSRYLRRQQVATRARRRLGVDAPVHLDAAELERIESDVDLTGVRDALDELPESQAEAVWLRVGHDLTYAEVATRLGCTEGAARVRVSRGLAHLADVMGAERDD